MATLDICIDKIATFLGPLLVLLAIVLIILAEFVFWTLVLPLLSQQYIHATVSIYLVYCILSYYALAVLTPPGNPPFPRDQSADDELTMLDLEACEQTLICRKCTRTKPLGTHHCSVCKICITRMDHHCPWICNCVGKHNHPYFYMFLVYLSVGCGYFCIVAFSFIPVIDTQHLAIFMFVFLICGAIGAAVFAMAVWHSYLIAVAQTTIGIQEQWSLGREVTFNNPQDLGIQKNFEDFFSMSSFALWKLLFPIPITTLTTWYRIFACKNDS